MSLLTSAATRPPQPTNRGARGTALALLLLAAAGAQATLPVETNHVLPAPPANPARLYLTDPVMPHLLDGRVTVIDGEQGKRLAVIGTGFSALTVLSPDRKQLYVVTTYLDRGQRGNRADVVEVYDTATLAYSHEIVIPAKHVQGLPIKALVQPSADGRFLLVQNATPATSVTVVDLKERKVASELPNPGCWGVLPWPGKATRFSTVCGDGTLQTFDLSDSGQPAGQQRSARFFDPETDPVFMHYALTGSRVTMVSFHGTVQQFDLAGDAPSFAQPWSFITEADRKQGWRPGGFALFDVLPDGQRLIVGMHAKGGEGSHKNPAEQLWSVDLAQHKRLARTPGHGAISMALTREAAPKLVLLSGLDNTLVTLDPLKPAKPLRRSPPMGETPVQVETH